MHSNDDENISDDARFQITHRCTSGWYGAKIVLRIYFKMGSCVFNELKSIFLFRTYSRVWMLEIVY